MKNSITSTLLLILFDLCASPISTNPQMFLYDLSKIEEVVFFVESVLYDSLLNPNRTYTPLKYPTTLYYFPSITIY